MWWHEYWGAIIIAIIALPIISIIGFAIWMRRREMDDLEVGSKCWDVFVKLISALTVIVAGAAVFGKYIDQKEASEARSIEQKRLQRMSGHLEFLQKEYDRKRRLLREAARVASRLTNSDPPAQSDLVRFDELYFADLIGVETLQGKVEAAMVCFRRKLKENDPSKGLAISGCPQHDTLHLYSLDLSNAVKYEVKKLETEICIFREKIYNTFPEEKLNKCPG